MIIVGERLNSSHKRVFEILEKRDDGALLNEAKKQEAAGAHYIDLNAAALLDGEEEALRWAVPVLLKELGVPLAIDTPNTGAMETGLKLHKGRALLNSLTGEKKRIERLLPLIREHTPRVIVLCLDDRGFPENPDKVLSLAERMVNLLSKEGLEQEDIFIDPLVRPVGADWKTVSLFLDSLDRIKKNLPGVKTIAGLSNVSFGLPARKLLNRTFLVLALGRGLDAAICDPLDEELQASIAASHALLGRDPNLKRFLRFARKKKESDL